MLLTVPKGRPQATLKTCPLRPASRRNCQFLIDSRVVVLCFGIWASEETEQEWCAGSSRDQRRRPAIEDGYATSAAVDRERQGALGPRVRGDLEGVRRPQPAVLSRQTARLSRPAKRRIERPEYPEPSAARATGNSPGLVVFPRDEWGGRTTLNLPTCSSIRARHLMRARTGRLCCTGIKSGHPLTTERGFAVHCSRALADAHWSHPQRSDTRQRDEPRWPQ
jgi:hypothetical protein